MISLFKNLFFCFFYNKIIYTQASKLYSIILIIKYILKISELNYYYTMTIFETLIY